MALFITPNFYNHRLSENEILAGHFESIGKRFLKQMHPYWSFKADLLEVFRV